jgi:hypothetical protein
MKRISTKIGDIFEAPLENGEKGYVQYIGNDQAQLDSDVIRVFKIRTRGENRPERSELVRSDIEFYSHVVDVGVGIKDGSWQKIGHSEDVGNLKDAFFRDPADGAEKREDGLWYGSPKISKSWSVWRVTEQRKLVPELTGENTKADRGDVTWPKLVVQRMQTGTDGFFYPDYK